MARPKSPVKGLNLASIEKRSRTLESRLVERFQLDSPPNEPHAELLREKVKSLQELIKILPQRVRKFRRPRIFLRIFFLAVTLGLIFGAQYCAQKFEIETLASSVSDLMQGVQAAEALLVAVGVGLYVLFSTERKFKRRIPIQDLARLRSLAHDVDADQTDVDPDRLVRDPNMNTPTSPKSEFSPFTMLRYFDYCAEVLSLIGTCVAYYNENCSDPEVQDHVRGIENATMTLRMLLGQKMAQITLLFGLPNEHLTMQSGTTLPAGGIPLSSTVTPPKTEVLVSATGKGESPATSLKRS